MPRTDFTIEFGRRLAEARNALGYSQKTLARLAKTSHRTVAGYELGETWPRVDIAARLAARLGVTLDELAGSPESPLPQPPEREEEPSAGELLDAIELLDVRLARIEAALRAQREPSATGGSTGRDGPAA